MATIIAALIAVAGTVISTAVSSSQNKKAMRMQEQNWKEQVRIEERDKRIARLERNRTRFQEMINTSGMFKQQVGALWGGK